MTRSSRQKVDMPYRVRIRIDDDLFLLEQMSIWCDTIHGFWDCRHFPRHKINSFYFSEEMDAVAFKLRWT